MNKYLILLFVGISFYLNMSGQSKCLYVESRADSLLNHFHYSEAALQYGLIADIYAKKHKWIDAIKNYRNASSSILQSDYPDSSKLYIDKACLILEKHQKKDEKSYCNERIKLLLTQSKYAEKKWKFDDEMLFCKKALNEVNINDSLLMADVWNEMATAYKNQEIYDSAIYFCKKSLDFKLNRLGEKNEDAANNYFKLGNFYFEIEDTFKTRECFEKALQIRMDISGKMHPATALCYNSLGKFHAFRAKYEIAYNYYIEALKIDSTIFGTQNLLRAQIYFNLGVLFFNQYNYNYERKYLQNSLKIQKIILGDNNPETANTLARLANIYCWIGEFDTAIYYLNKALPVLISYLGENHFRYIVSCYNELGIAYTGSYGFDKSLEYLQKALKIELKIFGENKSTAATLYSNMGKLYYKKCDYDRALTFYEKALQIKISCFGYQHPGVALAYIYIGNVYRMKNLNDEAMSYYQKALSIITTNCKNNIYLQSIIYNSLGSHYQQLKNWKDAIYYKEKALNIIKVEFGNIDPSVAKLALSLGNIYSKIKEYDKALLNYNNALQMLTKNSGQYIFPYLYNSYGEVFYNMGNYDKALYYFQKSIMSSVPGYYDSCIYNNPPLLNNAYLRDHLYYSLTKKADSFYQIFLKNKKSVDLDASLSAFECAFQNINLMRNEFSVENSKFQLNTDTKDLYFNAVHTALLDTNKFYKEKAFEFIEKGKSTILSNEINKLNNAHFASISDSLIKKEKTIKNIISKLSIDIDKMKKSNEMPDSLKMRNLENKLFVYQQKLDSIILHIEKAYPKYYTIRYNDKVVSSVQINNKLDTNTALLNYFISDTILYIAIISNTITEIKEIKIDSTFKNTALVYYKNIKKANTEMFVPNSIYLYNTLIKPAVPYLKNIKRLVIIPDEYLYYLPFETLINRGNTQTSDYTKLDYLIKKYSISYHYSATLWYNSLKKEEAKPSQSSFVGFAPVFNQGENNGVILSSNIGAIDTTGGNLAYRTVSSDLKNFNPLPNSKDEVISIFHLFEKKKKEAKIYLYSDASESNFKNNIADYTYVHVSSHGFSNDKTPSLSGIVFSQQPDTLNKTSQNEDGILYAGETYNLNLNADLVVLSSCESGLGKLIKGEGLQALSRGFIYAGTPNIIFSLWKELDKPTKDLMVNFYSNVLDGKSYDDALRMSKLDLIKDPRTAFPHFWGGFVLVGR